MKSIKEGYFKKEDIIIETLSCFKRAGADAILTYFASIYLLGIKDISLKKWSKK